MLVKLRKKQQRNLILVLAILVGASVVILWTGFFRKEDLGPGPEQALIKKVITINFETLQNPFLKTFLPFEGISQFGEQKGRENPFVPY